MHSNSFIDNEESHRRNCRWSLESLPIVDAASAITSIASACFIRSRPRLLVRILLNRSWLRWQISKEMQFQLNILQLVARIQLLGIGNQICVTTVDGVQGSMFIQAYNSVNFIELLSLHAILILIHSPYLYCSIVTSLDVQFIGNIVK